MNKNQPFHPFVLQALQRNTQAALEVVPDGRAAEANPNPSAPPRHKPIEKFWRCRNLKTIATRPLLFEASIVFNIYNCIHNLYIYFKEPLLYYHCTTPIPTAWHDPKASSQECGPSRAWPHCRCKGAGGKLFWGRFWKVLICSGRWRCLYQKASCQWCKSPIQFHCIFCYKMHFAWAARIVELEFGHQKMITKMLYYMSNTAIASNRPSCNGSQPLAKQILCNTSRHKSKQWV